MPTIQKDGSALYTFSGRSMIAHQEALRAILTHEGIPFSTGVGPSCLCVMVEAQYVERTKTVVQQWYEAMHFVQRAVVGS